MILFAPVHPQLENEPLITGLGIKIIPKLGELKDESLFAAWNWGGDEGDNGSETDGTELTKDQL